ncbi:MAG: hypothetical protein H7249_07120 [Chitinophagaceae bacterium]|nr:hypothetical protein [Oligoflexus sp.]
MKKKILFVRLSDYQKPTCASEELKNFDLVEQQISEVFCEALAQHYDGAVIELAKQERDYNPSALKVCASIAAELPTIFVGALDCEPLIGNLILSGAASFISEGSTVGNLAAFVTETIVARQALMDNRLQDSYASERNIS